MMIAEAIQAIQNSTSFVKREPVLTLDDGSDRQFIYSDQTLEYEQIERVVIQSGGVSNIESLAARVIEEARRRENTDGSQMTVTFTGSGASFSPDDAVSLDRFVYERAIAPAWKMVRAGLDSVVDHATFLVWLRSIRSVILDSGTTSDVVREFGKISFASKMEATSQPVLIDGASGSSYALTLTVGGKTQPTTLPSGFTVLAPYARGSVKEYEIPIEIDASLRGSTLVFKAYAPELPLIEQQAISDEIAWLRAQLADLPHVLILENF